MKPSESEAGCRPVLTRMLHAIVSHPRIYDLVQNLAGAGENLRRLSPLLADAEDGVVLDVGAGTGNCAALMHPSGTYVWLDMDSHKLSGFRAKYPSHAAILGDATGLGLKDKCVDYVTCIAMSHHLGDFELARLFRELGRVARKKLIFLDAVRDERGSLVSRLAWKYDRGSHPHTADALREVISQWFEIDHTEQYTIFHRYLLCTARPREASHA